MCLICLPGKAGIGKSSAVNILASDWVEGQYHDQDEVISDDSDMDSESDWPVDSDEEIGITARFHWIHNKELEQSNISLILNQIKFISIS